MKDYKKDELEKQIYKIPDTYVGGCHFIEVNLPVYTDKQIEFQNDENLLSSNIACTVLKVQEKKTQKGNSYAIV